MVRDELRRGFLRGCWAVGVPGVHDARTPLARGRFIRPSLGTHPFADGGQNGMYSDGQHIQEFIRRLVSLLPAWPF